MYAYRRIFYLYNIAFVTVAANYIIFQNHFVSRENAQFCCNKYGMALLSVRTELVSDVIENFIRTIPDFHEIWLGLYHDVDAQPFPEDFYWPDGTRPGWTNWENDTHNALLNNATFSPNATVCVKGELTPNNMQWKTALCNEEIQYACEVNVNQSVVPISQAYQDSDCPHLLKMTGKVFSRQGTVITNGVAKAETYGYFEVHDKIYTMGTQIGSYITKYNHDCALKCVNHPLCDEVIIVSQQLCILYQAH